MRRPDPHAAPGPSGVPPDDRKPSEHSSDRASSDPFAAAVPLPGLFDALPGTGEAPARPAPESSSRPPEAPHRAPETGHPSPPDETRTSGSRRAPPWESHPLAARAAAARPAEPQPTRAVPGTRARPLRVSELNRSIQTEIESAFPAVW